MGNVKKFMDDNFVLKSSTAQELYHKYAQNMPVIDYHCHLSVEDMAMNRKFGDITEAWLEGDHYKWRAMRTNGVDEKFITGDASSWEKFEKWAETVPRTLRNPLYHWTHMELKRYFGIDKLLSPATAREIFDEVNEKLKQDEYSVRALLEKMNVEVVCTTDDPVDSLEHHKKLAEEYKNIKILPAWRPDKAMAVEDAESYNKYIDRLADVAGMEIENYEDLLSALDKRHDFFAETGCSISDHGINTFYEVEYTAGEISSVFDKVRVGNALTEEEVRKFKMAMLHEFALMNHKKGWVQQFHYGALRNNNSRMLDLLGPDTGYDSIADTPVAAAMSRFFNGLAGEDKLAKTIIYNLNPADNELVATMIGNFQGGTVAGKMQMGSGWWFMDQKDGMERQINALSTLGLLSRFVGMLTDSRSFLSYPRHEYFRRILCDMLGEDVENGLLPHDMDLLGKMVEDISYNNAKQYFNL